MRLPGRRGTAAAQRQMQIPSAIVCPVCGLRNDITVRFCRNCGLPLGAPRDPVRGTTTKRAELPSDRGTGIATILGLLVVVGLVGGAGFLIFRGAQADTSVPGATLVAAAPTRSPATASIGPRSSGEPGASLPPATDPPTETDEPSGTDEPSETEEPVATEEPSRTDEPGPTKSPAGDDTLSAWTCKTASIIDPLRGRWRITRATWKSGSSTDRLTLSLSRTSGTARRPGAVVELAFMTPGRAASSLGVTRPLGDRAIVLTFDGPISVGTPMVGQPDMRALESVDIRRDGSGATHAVIGVSGDGCARLNAPEWREGPDDITTATVALDVRR